MNSMLDIIGSVIIGGLVMYMVIGLNIKNTKVQGSATVSSVVQSNATLASAILENDLRKIGFRCPDSLKFKTIEQTKLAVRGDFNDDGTLDSLEYRFDTTSAVYSSPSNTAIRMLYRTFNTDSASTLNLGFTQCKFYYYDSLNNSTTIKTKVKSIKTALSFASVYKYSATAQYDTGYYSMYWERIIKPKNLR